MNEYAFVADSFSEITSMAWCTGISVDDVIAGFHPGSDAIAAATLKDTWALAHELYYEGTRFVLVGALGDGVVVMAPSNCMSDSTLARLSQAGACLGVALAEEIPPEVTYLEKGQVVVTFDGIFWQYDATPDVETVERWMATTPGGVEAWRTDYGIAAFRAGEALVGAAFDDQWLAREHARVRIRD
ncbi:hypothetical protein ACQEVF_35465 [Nonomuraea polychroma]|uniref:hypothetical protein n=1 Tax=Nonomuraea polychroma TaxID=46176 RepID=UPI003D949CF7